MILCCKTSIKLILTHLAPFLQTTIIEHLRFIGNYKRDMPVAKHSLDIIKRPRRPLPVYNQVNTTEMPIPLINIAFLI